MIDILFEEIPSHKEVQQLCVYGIYMGNRMDINVEREAQKGKRERGGGEGERERDVREGRDHSVVYKYQGPLADCRVLGHRVHPSQYHTKFHTVH